MKRLGQLFVLFALLVVVNALVEPPAAQALPSAPATPSCNALYFQPCNNIYDRVDCVWSAGYTGYCQCVWYVQQPYGFASKVWDCFLTQYPL